ncbi:CLUMA_CG005421, isoform A [Clunio marinus]|uniref:Short-chain dehydrogenase/reductase 3 n=1 Tax=Clunio marinus TaxID=568069 RepID=A0A1J1HZ20_9DIPT|nr:CLUMA_CG005421, isoform A [Clunio marinus]
MENFEDFENKSYVPAREVRYTLTDHLVFIKNFLIVVLKVALKLVTEIAEIVIELFKPKKPKNISGQLALITGGANGLGRAIAFRLAQEKCNIVIVDVNIKEAHATASEIAEKFKVKTRAYKVDVSDYDAIQQLKNDVENDFGSVDILVNNAGILSKISLREGRAADVQKVINVNLTSHFWTVRTFIEKMIENRRGHIVAISSLGGKIAFPLACAYCATKFGVRGFMEALYDELCVDNYETFIKTTCVFPAFVNTRKELSDVLDQTKELGPRMSPRYAANKIVEGMLLDKRDITLPSGAKLLQIVGFFPDKTMKYTKTNITPVSHLQRAERKPENFNKTD